MSNQNQLVFATSSHVISKFCFDEPMNMRKIQLNPFFLVKYKKLTKLWQIFKFPIKKRLKIFAILNKSFCNWVCNGKFESRVFVYQFSRVIFEDQFLIINFRIQNKDLKLGFAKNLKKCSIK